MMKNNYIFFEEKKSSNILVGFVSLFTCAQCLRIEGDVYFFNCVAICTTQDNLYFIFIFRDIVQITMKM